MNNYYSQLDLINKYNLSNLFKVINILKYIEISFNKLAVMDRLEKDEKVKQEDKNTDLIDFMFFYSFFARSPKLITAKTSNFDKRNIKIQKKIRVYNKNYIFELLNYLTLECYISHDDVKIIRNKNGTFSITYEINLSYARQSLYVPKLLLARSEQEIPTIKVNLFFNKNDIKKLENVFPFWKLSHLDLNQSC